MTCTTSSISLDAYPFYEVMIWCIRAPDAIDVIQDNLVYQLTPPGPQGGSVPEWFEERAAGFTDEQRQAIVAYLHWYKGREERAWRAVGGQPPAHVDQALTFWQKTLQHAANEETPAAGKQRQNGV